MRLERLQIFFKTSPAVTLLKATTAPLVIAFLHRQFKAGRIHVPFSELAAALGRFAEDVRELEGTTDVLVEKPEKYLVEWCSDDKRWLRRMIVAGCDEPVFQLTPHTEAVLTFLDRALDQEVGFVGTESRLKLVIQTLSDLVMGASEDREARIQQLRQQKEAIEEQIAQLEAPASLPQKPAALVREQFATALGLLKQLLGDFRGVEEKFREITRQVQQRQIDPGNSRGTVLAFAMDEEDRLKQEDQGVSFHEFLRFILQPARQERLRAIIGELTKLRELEDMHDGMDTVRHMIPLLLADAEAVMRTSQRLSATLKRLLDQRATRERFRVAEILRDIRALAASCAHAPPRDSELQLSVDEVPELYTIFSRTFWSPATRIEIPPLSSHAVDEERRRKAFADYAKLYGLNWKEMRARIQQALHRSVTPHISDIVADHSLKAGAIELLGYVQIARDDGHLIDQKATEIIFLPPSRPGHQPRMIEIPLVTFRARQIAS